MIIYNVTINIQEDIHDRWLLWMNDIHIPEVLATGKFSSARLVRVHTDQPIDGLTYAAQFQAVNREDLQRYYEQDAPLMRQESLKLWADKALYFRTELEVVADHWPQ